MDMTKKKSKTFLFNFVYLKPKVFRPQIKNNKKI